MKRTPVKRIAPGTKLYSKTHLRTALIISDSTISRIPAWQLKKDIEVDHEAVLTKRHTGSTAEEISHFSTHTIDNIRPDQLIIIAGTNDISKGFREKSLDERKIVDDILSIAYHAKTVGCKNVIVSSILVRRGYHYKNIIIRINNILNARCSEEGFVYLDNSDVTIRHICDDGLHPNNYGINVLKMNILMCFYTFNPYLCDFYDYYEDAIL